MFCGCHLAHFQTGFRYAPPLRLVATFHPIFLPTAHAGAGESCARGDHQPRPPLVRARGVPRSWKPSQVRGQAMSQQSFSARPGAASHGHIRACYVSATPIRAARNHAKWGRLVLSPISHLPLQPGDQGDQEVCFTRLSITVTYRYRNDSFPRPNGTTPLLPRFPRSRPAYLL